MEPQGRGPHASILAAPIPLPTSVKVTLMIMAAHSCDYCGLTWLGVRRLILETGLGERAIQGALDQLVKEKHVKIRAYAKGGRGRATEYIVLPELRKLSTAPCGKCTFNQLNPARGAPFDKDVTAKPRSRRGVLAKPRTPGTQNPAPDAPPTNQEHQLTTNADPPASPPGAAMPPLSDSRPPTTLSEARARAFDLVGDIAAKLGMESPAAGNGGSLEKPGEGRGARKVPGAGEGALSGVEPVEPKPDP